MSLIEKLPSWLKNKYLLTSIVFVGWLLFFDDRDLISNLKHHQELKTLEQNRDYYVKENEKTRKELEQFPQTAEKYAREKYRMKRDNEDLYVIPD